MIFPLRYFEYETSGTGPRSVYYDTDTPVSTGDKRIPKEGYNKWIQPVGTGEDGKPFYNCQACNMTKSRHRPEFCPAIKTGCQFVNHGWRIFSWDQSIPGQEARSNG